MLGVGIPDQSQRTFTSTGMSILSLPLIERASEASIINCTHSRERKQLPTNNCQNLIARADRAYRTARHWIMIV